MAAEKRRLKSCGESLRPPTAAMGAAAHPKPLPLRRARRPYSNQSRQRQWAPSSPRRPTLRKPRTRDLLKRQWRPLLLGAVAATSPKRRPQALPYLSRRRPPPRRSRRQPAPLSAEVVVWPKQWAAQRHLRSLSPPPPTPPAYHPRQPRSGRVLPEGCIFRLRQPTAPRPAMPSPSLWATRRRCVEALGVIQRRHRAKAARRRTVEQRRLKVASAEAGGEVATPAPALPAATRHPPRRQASFALETLLSNTNLFSLPLILPAQ